MTTFNPNAENAPAPEMEIIAHTLPSYDTEGRDDVAELEVVVPRPRPSHNAPLPLPPPLPPVEADHLEEEQPDNANYHNIKKFLNWKLFSVLVMFVIVVVVCFFNLYPVSSNAMSVSSSLVVGALDNYVYKGVGDCLDKEGVQYPAFEIYESASSVDECPAFCECTLGIEGVKYRGLSTNSGTLPLDCYCLVDPVKDAAVITLLAEKCGLTYFDAAGTFDGTGKIKGSNSVIGLTCYKWKGKGKGAKATKTKAPKSRV
eukprot:scaffold11992_cov86-Skeletonema_menzelii.AAC.1